MITSLVYSKTGRTVKDHIVETKDREVNLYSYNSLVCSLRNTSQCDKIIVFGRDYHFSKTTMKYLVDFLRQNGFTELNNSDAINKAIEHADRYGYTVVNGLTCFMWVDNTMY
jgi:hypothetical protein